MVSRAELEAAWFALAGASVALSVALFVAGWNDRIVGMIVGVNLMLGGLGYYKAKVKW